MYTIEISLPPMFRDPGILHRVLDRAAERLITTMVTEMEREVAMRAPRGATGMLQQSMAGEVRGRGLAIRGVVGSSLFYAPVVELGRNPGRFPPPGPIQLWVQRKLGISGKEVRSVAYLVARKIARHGTEPQRVIERALEENRQRLQAWADHEAEHIAAELERGS